MDSSRLCKCGNTATYFQSPATFRPVAFGFCDECYAQGVRQTVRSYIPKPPPKLRRARASEDPTGRGYVAIYDDLKPS